MLLAYSLGSAFFVSVVLAYSMGDAVNASVSLDLLTMGPPEPVPLPNGPTNLTNVYFSDAPFSQVGETIVRHKSEPVVERFPHIV